MKTVKKTVVTMSSGLFTAKESILYCRKDGEVYRSQALQKLVPQRCTYGYDILVYVGKSLYLSYKNERTIKLELEVRNIIISESEIRFLGQKFIVYLSICHEELQLELKECFNKKGGYILHVDGTCEEDSPHLFTGLDEISGIVLQSIKISSESAAEIGPFLTKIKEKYGNPLAVVSDMGKGIMTSVAAAFPYTPYYICHFHFLRDIGKDLMEEGYRELRNRLKKSKIRTSLRNKAKNLEKKLGKNMGQITTSDADPVKISYLLIHWLFDTSSLSGYGFPFDLAHLLFYQRLEIVSNLLEKTLKGQKKGTFYQLLKILKRVMLDTDLACKVSYISEKQQVFNELRQALRITLSLEHKGLNDAGEPFDMQAISYKVSAFVKKYENSQNTEFQKMVAQIKKYDAKLFTAPIPVIVDNKKLLIQPQRTNNIMEQFFRNIKRGYRKKSGSSSLRKQLFTMNKDTPLARNLENKDYLKLLLMDSTNLEEKFAKIDQKIFRKTFKNLKSNTSKLPPPVKKFIKLSDLPSKLLSDFILV